MHVLATRPGGYAAGDGVVDLGQSPADVVFLSAADTDLALLADAAERQPESAPSLRLASLLALRSNASIDLYFEAVLVHAKVVIAAVLGGASYFAYGIERLVERARDGELRLVLVSGDDYPDAELTRLSTEPADDCERIWRYLREGGPHNAAALLAFVAARFFARGALPPPARPLPKLAVYTPELGATTFDALTFDATRPVAALLFYRAHLSAGNLAAFDALIATLRARGFEVLAIAVASLKERASRAEVEALLARTDAAIVLNTTGFAISSGEDGRAGALGRDGPVLQVIMSGGNVEDWQREPTGLSPRDLAMTVVLPEVDGRIITRAVSFKGLARRAARSEIDVATYHVDEERAGFVAELAARWVRLARRPRAERRIALVLANYPNRDGRLGNGVGLDTPASTVEILRALQGAGYDVRDRPADGQALMRELCARVTNDLDVLDTRPADQSVSLAAYRAFLASLPAALVAAVDRRWGPVEHDPRVRGDRIVVSGMQLGRVFVGIQPARAYQLDVAQSYHDPDLAPPHGYLAFYAWLRSVFDADAVVHVGKHGNLEWLPGKSVALSPHCFPDAVLGPTPHLYPFIVNDPGEGTQAKRRAQAVIIDHLVPPLTRAESYGALRDLEKLVDEYYQALVLDPPRALVLRRDILKSARAAGLDRELGLASHGDEERWLVTLDAYLCDLKESQIRDGLHVFGRSPAGEQRLDTLLALSRLPARRGEGGDQSLVRALARCLVGPDFDPLDADFAAPWTGPRPALLAGLSDDPWRSAGDTRERLELCARAILAGELEPPPEVNDVLERIAREVAPALDACGPRELDALLAGLDGRFVEPGPSGAPTRGRLDVLPTGRNFYSVDVRAVPTPAAFRLAERAAERLVTRYVQDHGEYPRTLALSLWGTATMRTGGDDVAQALALLGVRPVWSEGSGRVSDTEVLPASVLRRPRIDVVLRISGFFRDAFPDLVRLLDSAVRAVALLDEPDEVNPLRARVRADILTFEGEGLSSADAERRATYRVFGAKPGSYGAGVQELLDQSAWQTRADLGDAYLRHSGYAYAADGAEPAEPALRMRLAAVDAVLHNQDNREHDVLDSADYFEYQGGLSAAVEVTRGRAPALYHGDHHNPEAPRIRGLGEEVARVLRSRVVNPKWLAAARRHGYKGALEMAATVDFLFGYGATTDVVSDHQYALVSDAFLRDPENHAFLREHNPSALREMAERLVEAMQRGLWREPGDHRDALETLLVDAEEA